MSDGRDRGPPPRSPVVAGLAGRCPRCGRAGMFAGVIALVPTCPVCGLDYRFADTGDGPAFFASFIGGFVVLGAGVWMQLTYDPAAWVYLVVFVPFGTAICLALLRVSKGMLVALQFANKAGQGRWEH